MILPANDGTHNEIYRLRCCERARANTVRYIEWYRHRALYVMNVISNMHLSLMCLIVHELLMSGALSALDIYTYNARPYIYI